MKSLAAATLFVALLPFTSQAQVSLTIGAPPPPPVVEHYGPPPHPGYVWMGGYHRWDGHRYIWTRGHWGRRPHPGAVWIPGGYEHRGDGYHFHRGYWR